MLEPNAIKKMFFIVWLLFLGTVQTLAKTETINIPNAGLQAKLNSETGLIQEIISTEPTVKPVSGQMEIFCVLNGREYFFDKVLDGKINKNAAIFKLTSQSLKDSPIFVEVKYSWGGKDDYFQEKVSFTATRNIPKGCKIGFRHKWNPALWLKLIGGTRPIRAVPASQSTLYASGKGINDKKLTNLDKYQSSILPLFVVEGEDRFVLAGDFCVDSFITLSPNYPKNSFPSVQRNPLSMAKGETLSMTVNFRSFSNKTNLLRDVWRWYVNHLYSTDKEVNQYLTPVHDKQVPMGKGNWCSFTYYKKFREQRMPSGSHIWWSMWHDQVHERYPTDGFWYVNIPWDKGLMTAKRQKQELARIIAMGHKPYLYFRDLVNLRSVRHGHINQAWIKQAETGDYERYGTGRGLGWDMPAEITKNTGYKRVQWGYLNWSNNDLRDFYFRSFVKCIDYYKPKGVAFDFSWKSNEPKIQEMQGRMCKWVRKNYPDMKVAINDASGSPGQLLADVVLIENAFLGGKSWYDFEVAKAYRTNIVALERFNLFEDVVTHLVTGKKTWICPFGINDVKRLVDYFQATNPELKGNIEQLKSAAHLRAGMRDLALGAGWGYIEECPSNELVSGFAGEINGLALLGDSFAVQLPSGTDIGDNSYASAWIDDNKLRVALFNDSNTFLSTTVKIKVDKKWADCNNIKAFVITPLAEKYSTKVEKTYKDGMLELKVEKLNPFSLVTIAFDFHIAK